MSRVIEVPLTPYFSVPSEVVEASLLPHAAVPSHYGGENGEAADSTSTHWSILPRVATLPAMKEHHFRRCKKNPRAKDLLDRLWAGEFSFRCMETPESDPSMNSCITFIFEGDEKLNRQATKDNSILVIGGLLTRSDGGFGLTSNPIVDGPYKFFYDVLPEEEMQLLSFRITHHILRQHGAKISYDVFDIFSSCLRNEYLQRQRYREYLDVNICVVDILISKNYPQIGEVGIVNSYCLLGEALDARELYGVAAEVYQRAVSLDSDDKVRQYCLQARVATSLERDCQYDQAEEAYFRAIKLKIIHDEKQFLLADEDLKNTICGLLSLYSEVAGLPNPHERPANDLEKLDVALPALLLAADFQPLANHADRKRFEKWCFLMLKRPCLNPQVAHQILRKAFLESSPNKTRRKLLNCLIDGGNQMITPRCMVSDASMASKRSDDRHQAKKTLLERMPASSKCCNPNCEEFDSHTNPFQCCSRCQGPIYCSKECQKAHWKEHKKSCKRP